MAGPWEQYADQPSAAPVSGPWEAYGDPMSAAREELGKGLRAGKTNEREVRQAAAFRENADLARDTGGLSKAGGATALASGATLGWSDEALAALAAPIDMLRNGESFSDAYEGNLARERDRLATYRKENPKTALAAETAGAFAAGPGRAIASAPTMLGRTAQGALQGGVFGGIAGAGSADGGLESRLSGAKGGAAIGSIAGATLPLALGVARRAVTPLPANAERQAAADILAQEGVPLTAGQRTGSKPLQWFESALSDVPGGGGRAARIAENQGEAFTGAALRRVGENATRATPEVIDRAFTRIGQQFDDLAGRNTLRVDQPFVNDMTRTAQEYVSLVPPSSRAPIVENTMQDIVAMARRQNATLPGETYQAIRSRLDKAARASRNDPQLQDALFGVRNALDAAMERSISPADRAAWQTARQQYRNLMVVEKAATGAGENAAQGMISPSQLRNATVNQNRRSYARGRGDFADLARAGEATMKPLPQSGTAPRQNVQNIFTGIGAIGGTMAGGTVGGAAGAAASIAGPALGGRLLMSRPAQGYLGNQLLNANPVAFERLLMGIPIRSSVPIARAIESNP